MAHRIMEWNEQMNQVFLDRYARKDSKGNILEDTLEEMWCRVADCIANTDKEAEDFLSILTDFEFVPSGRVLSGAKVGQSVTYYNCFVIGVRSKDLTKGNDSRQGIMDTITSMIEITSRGGGVGINWSTLRPAGDYIKGVHGHSSGSNSWMRGADGMADQIRQGGSRTAALMFMLEDWHPDIVEFIKQNERFKRANFSVGISDRFMRALENDEDWVTIFPDTSHPLYDREWDGDIEKWLKNGLPVIEHSRTPAKVLWRMMCEGAYAVGSPGMIFLERCNKLSNTWYMENLVCMNPCGEQPLPANGSCNLGSINLVAFWNPTTMMIDWSRLSRAVRLSIRFLDSVIDKSVDIDKDIGDMQRVVRRVGLGTMGLADLMILKGVRYGSEESLSLIDTVYSFIRDEAYASSVELAREKGPAPGFRAEDYLNGEFIKTLPESIRDSIREYGIRNLQLMTQAPTGTTSILAGASSGVEPIYSRKYTRKDATGEHKVVHPLFADRCASFLVTASQVSVIEHIKVQARLQKYLDSAISKTINLPSNCTIEDIDEAYREAYSLGCKGVTVYRSGSLGDVLVEDDEEEEFVCKSCNT